MPQQKSYLVWGLIAELTMGAVGAAARLVFKSLSLTTLQF